jgi:hypothetical protein
VQKLVAGAPDGVVPGDAIDLLEGAVDQSHPQVLTYDHEGLGI